MAQLNVTKILAVGVPVKLNDAILNAQTGQLVFRVPVAGQGNDITVLFQAIGSSMTGLSADLQLALDGNFASLANYKTSLVVAATPFAAVAQSSTSPIAPGALYCLNITALTGTSVDIWALVN